MATIEFRNVTRIFRQSEQNIVALQDVNLQVQDQEFVAIVGPSGCGKTTCLRMAAGLEKPSSGQVLVDGQEVRGPGTDRAVVFQQFALFPWKTVWENIEFGLISLKVPVNERNNRIEQYISLMGLEGYEGAYPHQLSGGMQQRVGVVRALANNPDVLLMDEPFASVDAQTRMTLQEELTRVWQERKTTILFITHDVSEAVFLADRVIVLGKGHLKDEIVVDLPRPRQWDVLIEDERFKTLSSQVLHQVRSA